MGGNDAGHVESLVFEGGSHSVGRRPSHAVGVRLADDSEIPAACIIDAAGAWAGLLSSQVCGGLAMAPTRSHYWLTVANDELFPAGHPNVILPDAGAYTRSEVGQG